MEDQEYAEHIFSIIANVRADIAIKKDLETHYLEALNALSIINEKADEAARNNQNKSTILFKVVGYELYRLKDEMIKAITDKQGKE
ncbi:hypothetical protein [Mucilaginibacter sp.]|jgi:hypothetical protein|uniref:hypothetical protein n=1 Tax=Mucilaginibacter sp. TaxID=1882438 RepID=UPI00261EA2A2|nr:hypothetical protein [Mucilaginibacter sp.]MDB4926542.1 hypothetical protein [Mucilaginibacter sp.]